MDFIKELNRLYMDRVEFHTKLVQKHKEIIEQLNIDHLKELHELLSENIESSKIQQLDESTLYNAIHGKPSNEPSIDDNTSNKSPSNKDSSNSGKLSDEPSNKDQSDETFNDVLSSIDEQDLILERMSRARLQADAESNTIAEKKNNLLGDQLIPELKPRESFQKEKKAPMINALSKFNTKQQQNILRQIFGEAKNNIEDICKIDETLRKDYDTLVKKEADRLLDVYLKSH